MEQKILEMLQKMDARLGNIEQEMTSVKQEITSVKEEMTRRFDKLEGQLMHNSESCRGRVGPLFFGNHYLWNINPIICILLLIYLERLIILRNVLKLGVFTIFTACIISFASGESQAKPGLYDEGPDGRIRGHVVNVGGQQKYVSLVPKPKPAARKPAPKPAPKAAPKPAPKPTPNPVDKKADPKYTPFKVEELVKRVVVTGASTAAVVAIPAIPTGELAVIPATVAAGATAGASYVIDWGWDNAGYGSRKFVDSYKKASVLEDPMGRSFPH